MWMHSLLKSSRWSKKQHRKSEDITETFINTDPGRRRFVSCSSRSFKVSCVLIQTETKAFFSSTRSGSWRLRWLGLQPGNQVLLHVRAAGPRPLRFPPAALTHTQGLQRGADSREDHRTQGYRENSGLSGGWKKVKNVVVTYKMCIVL